MIDTEALKRKILDLAIKGKLVPQDSNDEPASELLKRIKNERDRLIDEGKIKGKKDDFSYIFKGDDNCYYEKIGKEVKNINDEIPFEIPNSWAWQRIGSYCLKVTDFVASGSFKSLRENVNYYKNPNYALMVKTQDFQNNFTDDLTYTDEHGYNFLSNSNLYGGELILSNVGSVGKVYIVPHLKLKMTLAPNTIMVRFFDEKVNLYLYYLMQSKFGYTCLKNITSATAIQKFNKTDFKNILIPVPPKNEQLKIIEYLKNISTMINEINDLNAQIRSLKSQIKNKIINLGIHGKLLNSDDNYYYQKIDLKYEPLCTQVEILDQYRKPINSSERENRLNKAIVKYPYYGATGKAGEIDAFLLEGQHVLIGEDCAPFLNKYLEKAYVVDGKFWVNNHAHILKSVCNDFLYFYLNSFDYHQYVSGTTRLKLTQKDLKRIPYPVLPKDIQNKISKSIKDILKPLNLIV